MEARNDRVGRQNDGVSGEKPPNGFLKSVNPFLDPAQKTVSRLGLTGTNPFLTQATDSNGNTISRDNNQDLMLGHGQSNGWYHFPASSRPLVEDDWAVFPPRTLGRETNQTRFTRQIWDTVQESRAAKISATGPSKEKSNFQIFDPFRDENSVPQTTLANEKTPEERVYLLEYMLANQKNNEQSFLSSTASNPMDVFPDSSSFLHAPVIDNDVFANIDVQPPESGQQSLVKAFQNIRLFQNQASVQNELSDGMFQGPSTLSSPLNASTNEGSTFKRRPPKPAPRTKAPKASKAPDQDTIRTDELNKGQVYEDVLFIGQEMCVEDWPEDSPELSPDWKPVGKFKLRRESMKISQEDEEAFNADPFEKKAGKKKKRLSISRGGSKDKSGDDSKVLQTGTVHRESPKEKFPDSLNGAYGGTLPWGTKLMYYESDDVFLPKEEEDPNAVTESKSVKNKKTKFIVPHLKYRGSKKKSIGDVFENGSHNLQASEREKLQESYEEKLKISEQKEPEMKEHRPKKPMKLKLSLSYRLSKDSTEDDPKKMNSFSFEEDLKENSRAEKENRRFSEDFLAEYQHDDFSPKSPDSGGKRRELQDCRKKKSIKFSVPHLSRKGSKSAVEHEILQKRADPFKAGDIKGSEIKVAEDYSLIKKSSKRVPLNMQRDLKGVEKGADFFKAGDGADDGWTEKRTLDLKAKMPKKAPVPSKESKGVEKGADFFKAGDGADDGWTEKRTLDLKAKMPKKAHVPSKESKKAKDQMCFPEDIEPPGATSGGYYLSEAAKAEWMSSQMDVRRARTSDNDEELDPVKEEVDGDTDSLMEWWNMVELWDELPDEEIGSKEDETISFTEIADKVHRGLRVFYKVFTEHAEVLYQHVLCLYSISDDISNFHRCAKIANITGGTTTAVGGVTAITGLALAPVTLGISLIVSAVGLGVATAGGITAASATISDNVHDMNDRKKIEVVVQDYESRLAELRRCLQFVAEGLRRMRFHPLLRRNNYYTGDWEVRRALQTISLVGDPVEYAEDIVGRSMVALNRVCKGMDNYYCRDSKELKKGCKKEVTTQVNMLAKLLHEGLVALNSIREQLMEAMGHV